MICSLRSFATLLVACLCFATSSYGQLLVNPASMTTGESIYEGSFTFSDLEYESENNSDIDVERKTLGFSMTMDMGSDINLAGQFGLILESEYENLKDEGKGWLAGLGLKFHVTESEDYKIVGHGLFNYLTETYDFGSDDLEVSIWDLHTGITSVFSLNSNSLQPYAGVDLVIVSDGEAQIGSIEADFDRDDLLSIKLGAMINLESITIRPEATLLGEQSFTLAFSASQ